MAGRRIPWTIRALATAAVCAGLGACASGSGFSADDAISGLTTGLTAAAQIAGAAGGMGGGSYSAPRSTSSGSTSAHVTTGNGYSQRGAFDDCAALYGGAGASQQAALCNQRANSMNSLH